MKQSVLGVKIDQVNMDQAVEQIFEWVREGKNRKKKDEKWIGDKSRYVVTPNIEFLMLAQKDQEFKRILNEADLSVPDSARLSWAYFETHQKNLLLKLLAWPFFLAPRLLPDNQFETVTGTDLMEEVVERAAKNGTSIGLLGGRKGLAEELKGKLIKQYSGLNISFANSDLVVNKAGDAIDDLNLSPTDILFVAFGQGKQEKWIAKNINQQKVKVMIGVGGAFDYLSGDIARAPKIIRKIGMEWLFRLILQPWRIKRFWAILKFIFLVLKS